MIDEVLARPHDDEPRRAVARALTERGDPRGRFIELQLEVARLRREADVSAATWGKLWLEADALRVAHGASWVPQLPAWASAPMLVRGFVEYVEVDADAFVRHAPALFAVAPIRRLHLRGITGAHEVLSSIHLARMISLDFSGNTLGDVGAAALATSPHVTHVLWLDLAGNQIGAAGLDALLSSMQLRSLRYLRFAANLVPTPEEGYGVDNGVVDTSPTEATLAAEARYGLRAWLRAPSLHPYAYPPEPDDLLGSRP